MKRFRVKRKSERWVSNNRVLLGSSKKDPGRNPNFDNEETKLLITLWGDPKIQRTLITTHRKHSVIAKLAEKMNEYGYSRSAEEINTRIKNLKCFYNRLKKDIEMGIINVATWKHFAAMDEIMTRSIFSVRPNEIPKPSLKYQLEVEQSEREERNKLRAEIAKAGKSLNPNAQVLEESVSNSGESYMTEDVPEVNDAHTSNTDENTTMEFEKSEDSGVKIKEEGRTDSLSKDFEETPLIIPKEEPIDVDEIEDEEVQFTVSEITSNPESLPPRIPEYIQIPTNNSNPITFPPNCHKLLNNNQNSPLQTPPLNPPTTLNPGMPQSIVFTNPTNSLPGGGKISLVPANFLLQNNPAQTQQIQLRPQPQQRIICTQPNPQPNSNICTNAGPGRMKVLLVNTIQNGKPTNSAAVKEPTFANPSIMTTANIQKTNTPDPMIFKNCTEAPKSLRTEEAFNTKDPGVELLFNKLIMMQNENNEIQRQRLEIERQRLEFEKAIADKLLTALTSLTQVQKPAKNTKTKERKPNSEQILPPDIREDFNGYELLTPKIEKEE